LSVGIKKKAVQVLDRIMEKGEGDDFENGYNLGTISKKDNIEKVLSLWQ